MTITRYAYINTRSAAGRPTKVEFEPSDVIVLPATQRLVGGDRMRHDFPLQPEVDSAIFGIDGVGSDGGTVEINVWRSDGSDGAWVVQIDTNFEPDDLPRLRINLNDEHIYGPEWRY